MTIKELKHFMDEDDSIFIIDIREPYECEDGSICDLNIPLGQILNRIDEIPKNKNVVFYCNSGKRSKSLKIYARENSCVQQLIAFRRWV